MVLEKMQLFSSNFGTTKLFYNDLVLSQDKRSQKKHGCIFSSMFSRLAVGQCLFVLRRRVDYVIEYVRFLKRDVWIIPEAIYWLLVRTKKIGTFLNL